MTDIMWVILAMMVVTYIPRMIPFYMVHGKKLPDRLKRFLNYVPYAALGALIIPGAFSAIEGEPLAVGVGLLFALVFSWIKGGVIVPVVGSMGAAFLVLLIGG